MKYILTIGLLLSLVCCVVVYDVSADAPDAHGMADIRNAKSEQERHQKVIDEYIVERNRFISLANDLKVIGGGTVGSLKTILVSTLTTTNHEKIATAFGLATRTVLSIYGSSSVGSMIDSAISNANSYHGSAQYLYNNSTRLIGFDAANSAIEAWHKAGQATDHYNTYHSSVSENAPSPPIGPGNINLPQFKCPGTCTQTFTTVSAASSTHHQKCGTAAPVSRLLSGTERLTMLAARSVSEGCGESWYSCDSNHSTNEAYHRVRTCAKGVWKTRYKDYTNGKERYRSHTCGDSFRNCLPHKDYHGSSTFKTVHSETDDSGSENPVVSPPPPPTPPPSPTYHACGEHETSVSGDHSLQASCSSTDSNGNYCTVTNFYACDSHTHSYPAPPPTPTPTPPPEPTPTPPSPTTVACGAAGWTGCTIRSSDGNACRVDPCDSGCGSYYWSCSTSGVSWHKTSRTCQRTNCGASYTNCTRGDGTCSGGKYTWHKQ